MTRLPALGALELDALELGALETSLTRDYWHLVGHRCEVARPGDYLRLDWPLGELVIFNDQGALVAFDNLCPHRGGRFFTGDHGSGRAVCPYHGWSYQAGELRPARRELFEPSDLDRARLNTWTLQTWGDFLFVGVQPILSLGDQLDALGPELAGVSADLDSLRDTYALDFEAHWRVAVENVLEAYHVNAVHGDTLAPLALTGERFAFAGLNSSLFADIGAAQAAARLRGLRRLFDLKSPRDGFVNHYLFPFATLTSTSGHFHALQNFFPTAAPDRSRFYSRLFGARLKPGAQAAAEPLFTALAAADRRIIDEDHAICRRVSPAYDLDRPDRLFASSEIRIRRLHAQLADLASARAPVPVGDQP